ncbi:MAG: ABC transporter permease [Micrococcales bacterium]
MAQLAWVGATKLVNYRKASLLGAWYVAEYRIRAMLHWIQSIVAFGLGNPVLYLTSVGIGVGSLVDKNLGPGGIEGVGYLTFLAPALLASASIQGAMDEAMFPIMQGFVWDKSFWAMNSTQLTGRTIYYGVLIAAWVRCLLTVVLYEAILILFGAISWGSVLPLAFSAMFAGMAFSALMGAASAFIKQDDGFFAIIGRFVITPMFMFSGTFYPLESLPGYLQWIGWISPLWHATNAGRALSYGLAVPAWLMLVHFAIMAVMLVVGLEVGARQFNRRLAK